MESFEQLNSVISKQFLFKNTNFVLETKILWQRYG